MTCPFIWFSENFRFIGTYKINRVPDSYLGWSLYTCTTIILDIFWFKHLSSSCSEKSGRIEDTPSTRRAILIYETKLMYHLVCESFLRRGLLHSSKISHCENNACIYLLTLLGGDSSMTHYHAHVTSYHTFLELPCMR